MGKLIAIINVIAWSGFWVFGSLALFAEGLTNRELTIASLLAFAGLLFGMTGYLKLVRMAEDSGYARKSSQLNAETRNRAHAMGMI